MHFPFTFISRILWVQMEELGNTIKFFFHDYGGHGNVPCQPPTTGILNDNALRNPSSRLPWGLASHGCPQRVTEEGRHAQVSPFLKMLDSFSVQFWTPWSPRQTFLWLLSGLLYSHNLPALSPSLGLRFVLQSDGSPQPSLYLSPFIFLIGIFHKKKKKILDHLIPSWHLLPGGLGPQ